MYPKDDRSMLRYHHDLGIVVTNINIIIKYLLIFYVCINGQIIINNIVDPILHTFYIFVKSIMSINILHNVFI